MLRSVHRYVWLCSESCVWAQFWCGGWHCVELCGKADVSEKIKELRVFVSFTSH